MGNGAVQFTIIYSLCALHAVSLGTREEIARRFVAECVSSLDNLSDNCDQREEQDDETPDAQPEAKEELSEATGGQPQAAGGSDDIGNEDIRPNNINDYLVNKIRESRKEEMD